MPHQQVRPSQFVLTFGPGSIVETDSGPVVLKSMDTLFNAIGRQPQDFHIIDERLSRLSLNGARIARIPTNAELGLATDNPIYPTDGFPYWSLCAQHSSYQVLYEASTGCPECPRTAAYRVKAGREAIRFVVACENGHMDDVYWHGLVHNGPSCGTRHYRWSGGGRALRHVSLTCPKCGKEQNLGQAYGHGWRCTGRQPEYGGPPRRGTIQCSKTARIIQRGASNLHVVELATALTTMDVSAHLHAVLSNERLLGALGVLHRQTGNLNREALLQEGRYAGLTPDAIEYLARAEWKEIETALNRMLDKRSSDPESLRGDELDWLRSAGTHGAPAIPSSSPGSPPLFEVRREDVRSMSGPHGRFMLRAVPVSRLRMVMVQTGYRRLSPDSGRLVSTAFQMGGATWYPGIELFGEGIFLDTGDSDPDLTGSRVFEWQHRHAADPVPLVHPVHVWWHTLSHCLLRALSVDSGYSSAAIRERVYLRLRNGQVAGSGLLLYTVQPGGDGTMGGMVALVRRFQSVLTQALWDVDTCSNDPLCAEAPANGAEGAACYSCLFASETSCEHRNQGLDRLLLSENCP